MTSGKSSEAVYQPAARKAAVKNIPLSTSCPKKVELIHLSHLWDSPVKSLILATTNELVISPKKNAAMLAIAMIGLDLNIKLKESLSVNELEDGIML
jgi:hypothetical protein